MGRQELLSSNEKKAGKMVIVRKMNPVVRAVATIAAVATLVTGATFAALSSSVTLTDNTISAGDANLQIWDGTAFASTAQGFNVDDLVPGEWSDENFVYFKNVSEGNLDLTVQSTEPEMAEGSDSFGFTGWENLKVRITSHSPECSVHDGGEENNEPVAMTNTGEHDGENEEPSTSNVVVTDMAALIAGDVELPCNSLSEGAQGDAGNENTEGNYSLAYKIPSEVVEGDDVNIGNYDLTFTGTLVGGENETPEEPGVGTPPEEEEAILPENENQDQ